MIAYTYEYKIINLNHYLFAIGYDNTFRMVISVTKNHGYM